MAILMGAKTAIQLAWRFRTLFIVIICAAAITWFKHNARKQMEKINEQHQKQILDLKQQHVVELRIVKEASAKYEQQVQALQKQHDQDVQQIIEETPQVAQKFLATYKGRDYQLWEQFAKQYGIQITK